ncbi:MAG: YggS family pyridoxal phosphate-dependent enzyme [Ghiorsea sp.]
MSQHAVVQSWQNIQNSIMDKAKLIAVSKYTSDENVQILLDAGHKDFAESKPQNLRDRANLFPQANWHMIGPLQKNKAKYVGRHAHMWHSLCDIDTAKAVAQHVSNRVLPVLIQVNISGESQKQGVKEDDLPLFFEQLNSIEGLEVIGLMGMAAKDTDPKSAFSLLRSLRDQWVHQYPTSHELCMGMSNDWRIAIEEGATMIRVGSEIFGQH